MVWFLKSNRYSRWHENFRAVTKQPISNYHRYAHAAFAAEYTRSIYRDVPSVVRWLFLVFVFSIPFEHLAVVKYSSVMFFALYFFYYNPVVENSILNKRLLPPIGLPIVWFAGYAMVFGAHCFVSPNLIRRFFTLVLLLIMLKVVTHLFNDRRLMRDALFIYSIGAAIVATGMLLNVPGIYSEFVGNTGVRVSAFGQDPNLIGVILVFAFLWLLGLYVAGHFQRTSTQLVLVCLLGPLLGGIIATSSRTALVSLVVGGATNVFAGKMVTRKKIIGVIALICAPGIIYVGANNPVFVARVQEAIYEGKSAGREKIFGEALDMVSERPLFGWGPEAFQYELGFRVGRIFGPRDAHNLYLHLLLEVGVVGALPFLVGLWLCVVGSWRSRDCDYGPMPLSAIVALCVASLGLPLLVQKPTWLVFACAISASTGNNKRFPNILRGIRNG